MLIQAKFVNATEDKKTLNSAARPLPANKNTSISCTKALTYASKNLQDTNDCAFTEGFQNRLREFIYLIRNSPSPKK